MVGRPSLTNRAISLQRGFRRRGEEVGIILFRRFSFIYVDRVRMRSGREKYVGEERECKV